eukprot:2305085-Rhodomonas_salina.4
MPPPDRTDRPPTSPDLKPSTPTPCLSAPLDAIGCALLLNGLWRSQGSQGREEMEEDQVDGAEKRGSERL